MGNHKRTVTIMKASHLIAIRACEPIQEQLGGFGLV